jgi:tetratricopeptide (TPR) repeat protein
MAARGLRGVSRVHKGGTRRITKAAVTGMAARLPARTVAHTALLVALVTAGVFWRATHFPFLNWDDQAVFVRNASLHAPGVLRWAFTTRYVEHYQPLAWAAWAGLDRAAGLTAADAHMLNVLLHAACSALVCVLVLRVTERGFEAPPDQKTEVSKLPFAIAGMVALVWALHPLRVEPVVWASAMPYPLALLFALVATLAWFGQRPWTAVAALTLSLLARPLVFLLPIVLWIAHRPAGRRGRLAMMSMVAAAAAAVAFESSARLTASVDQFGIGPRLTLAAAAPWRYLWRTLWPIDLTPLDPLALTPQMDPVVIVAGVAGVALVSIVAWRWRRESPVLSVAWMAYLALLAPAMGLVPSGLQATADRYTYAPAIALAIVMAELMRRALTRIDRVSNRRARFLVAAGAALPVVAILTALTWQQTSYWGDSVVLWTRAVTLDPQNDIALYNLASALAELGRRDEATARYEAVLQIVPTNEAARRNRDLLVAQRLEEEANRLASNKNFDEAIDRYTEAVRLDPERTHSQAALGMALTERGRYEEARPHLQLAVTQGVTDAAVPNALAFVLAETGRPAEAEAVLRDALRQHPDDADISRNLAIMEKRKGGR